MPMPMRSSERKRSSASSRVIMQNQDTTRGGRISESGAHRDHLARQGLCEEINAEERLGIALAPAIHGPLDAKILHISVLTEVEQNLIRSTIELLRKSGE